MALCNCRIGKRTQPTTQIGDWDGCPLNDSGHTSFMVLRCNWCKGILGFPSENLNIALKKGTDETKKKLAEIIE